MKTLFTICSSTLLLSMLLGGTFPQFASGGFSGGGVQQIPQGKDREKFHLGKAVYNQEVEISSKVDNKLEETQSERLEYLQGSLPNADKKRVYLPDWAGKLTPEQLDALEYFVSVRFNVKVEKK